MIQHDHTPYKMLR